MFVSVTPPLIAPPCRAAGAAGWTASQLHEEGTPLTSKPPPSPVTIEAFALVNIRQRPTSHTSSNNNQYFKKIWFSFSQRRSHKGSTLPCQYDKRHRLMILGGSEATVWQNPISTQRAFKLPGEWQVLLKRKMTKNVFSRQSFGACNRTWGRGNFHKHSC